MDLIYCQSKKSLPLLADTIEKTMDTRASRDYNGPMSKHQFTDNELGLIAIGYCVATGKPIISVEQALDKFPSIMDRPVLAEEFGSRTFWDELKHRLETKLWKVRDNQIDKEDRHND